MNVLKEEETTYKVDFYRFSERESLRKCDSHGSGQTISQALLKPKPVQECITPIFQGGN